jgi:prolyl-tRNA synthetase
MAHGDDDGLILPPKLAPSQVVILPIIPKQDFKGKILDYCNQLALEIREVRYNGCPVAVEIDDRDLRGGEKFWHWVKKGVPLRIEIGPNEIENESVSFSRRDKESKDRVAKSKNEFVKSIVSELNDIQDSLYQNALKFRDEHLVKINSKDDFYDFFTPENKEKPEIHGGFAYSHWSGDIQEEEQIKEDLNVTIRNIPLDGEEESGKCVISGKPSQKRVIFAKAY